MNNTGSAVTVMFSKYFGVHQLVVRSGLLAKMKPSECGLYLFLMHESERKLALQLKLREPDVARSSGVASQSLFNARKKLREPGCYPMLV